MSLSQTIEAFASTILLFFLLNSCIFFNLSDIINHIYNYFIGFKYVKFYWNVIESIAVIFKIESIFLSNCIIVIKKNNSWQNKKWTFIDIIQIFFLLACYNKAIQVRRNCRYKQILKILNKYQDLIVTSFFYSCHKTIKTLRQLVYLASSFFCYFDTG